MKVVVIGAGAMGCALGAHLDRAGNDVFLVDTSSEVIAAIRREGAHIETPEQTFAWRAEVTDAPGTIGGCDLLVVFVKGSATRAAISGARGVVGPDTTVVSLQNGWGGGDIIAEFVDPTQVVIGVTYSSATATASGSSRLTGWGSTYVGPQRAASAMDRADAVAALLTASGWPAQATSDIATEIWKKLILNAATLPTAALTGLSAGQLAGPTTIDLVDALAREAVTVARAQGLGIDPDERVRAIASTLERAGDGKPSMLQDVLARRRTEIATINGAVVRAGDRLGVPVPLNRAMVALVDGLESGWRP